MFDRHLGNWHGSSFGLGFGHHKELPRSRGRDFLGHCHGLFHEDLASLEFGSFDLALDVVMTRWDILGLDPWCFRNHMIQG